MRPSPLQPNLHSDVERRFRTWLESRDALDKYRRQVGVDDDVAQKLVELRDLRAAEWIDAVKVAIYAVAFRITRSRRDAEDAVMSTLAIALHARRFPRDEGGVLTWITRIAVQRASHVVRARGRWAGDAPMETVAGGRVEGDDAPPAAAQPSARRRRSRRTPAPIVQSVAEAVARLPKDQRLPLELAGVNDLTHGEVAELLEIPETLVKYRIELAKRRVVEHLSGRDVYLTIAHVELLLAARPVSAPSADFLLRGAPPAPVPRRPVKTARLAAAVTGLAAAAVVVALYIQPGMRAPAGGPPGAGGAQGPATVGDFAPARATGAGAGGSVRQAHTAPRSVPVLHGRVVNPDGSPAAGAEVIASFAQDLSGTKYRPAIPPKVVKTTPKGLYSVDVPAEANGVVLKASLGPYRRSETTSRRRGSNSPLAGFAPGPNAIEELVLLPAGAVSGVVKLENGAPVADAVISLTDALQRAAGRVKTKQDGSFEIAGVRPGPHRARIVKDLVVQDIPSLVVAPDETLVGLTWVLEKTHWQDVRVVEADGRPAAGALVFAEGSSALLDELDATDSDGKRRILAPLGKEPMAAARSADRCLVVKSRLPRSPSEGPWTLTLPRDHSLTLACVDAETGAPVAEFRVAAASAVGLARAPFVNTRDGSATLRLDPAFRGPRSFLWVQAKGYADARVPVESSEVNPRVALERGVRVTGRVVDPEGSPIELVCVAVAHGGELICQALTGADGGFVLERVPRWADTVLVWAANRPSAAAKFDAAGGGSEVNAGTIEIAFGCQVILNVPSSARESFEYDLTGRIAGSSEGDLQAHQWGELVPGETRTIGCLWPGEWCLYRTFGNLGGRTVKIPVAKFGLADGEVKVMTLEGPPPSLVRGSVKPDGVPPERLEMVAVETDSPRTFAAPVDAEGGFEFTALPTGGQFLLTARLRGSTDGLEGLDVRAFWKSSLAMLADPSLARQVALVSALPGVQPPISIAGSLLTASADVGSLGCESGARLEVYADTPHGRTEPPWVVHLDKGCPGTLGIPAGAFLVRVYRGESFLGELRSAVQPGETAIWELPR